MHQLFFVTLVVLLFVSAPARPLVVAAVTRGEMEERSEMAGRAVELPLYAFEHDVLLDSRAWAVLVIRNGGAQGLREAEATYREVRKRADPFLRTGLLRLTSHFDRDVVDSLDVRDDWELRLYTGPLPTTFVLIPLSPSSSPSEVLPLLFTAMERAMLPIVDETFFRSTSGVAGSRHHRLRQDSEAEREAEEKKREKWGRKDRRDGEL
mmetsp:Transcript_13474/g.35399  ORF Transcript_13474/g.35399 Transcript_13474/m.35399 type:complete len:208 (-) Transcript_13474:1839-2462(-)